MGIRVHTSEATAIAVEALTAARINKLYSGIDEEELAELGEDEVFEGMWASDGLVLEDAGNLEAWVIHGTQEEWRQLGADIVLAASENTHALKATIVDGNLYFTEDVNETLATILPPDELGDWLDTASADDPTGKVVAGLVMLTGAIAQEHGDHDATVIVYTDGTLSWCVLPLAE